MPLYSVIIPVYNASSTLENCVDSIINQSFRDLEIILINDGSTDNSLEICNRYATEDNRIKVVNKENGGVSSARNAGLDIAKGDWVSFVDADDYIETSYFPAAINYECSLYIGGWKPSTRDSYVEFIPDNIYKDHKNIKSFLNNYIQFDILRCPWGKFFLREIIKLYNLRFDSRFFIGEDTLFVMDYLQHCNSIIVDNHSTYKYFQRNGYDNANKYALSISQSLEYLTVFLKKYKELDIDNPKILNLLYHYYKGKTKEILIPEVEYKWLHHHTVLNILWLAYYKNNPSQYIFFFKLWLEALFVKR